MVLELFASLVSVYGYIGVFIVSLVSNASVIFPIPSIVMLIGAVKFLDPVLLAVVFAFGSAIGELVGYLVGFGSRKAALKTKKKWSPLFNKIEEWFEKHGAFAVIIVFAATPLPHDVVGLFCGFVKYDMKRFFVATFIGKLIQALIVVYASLYSINFLLSIFGWG